MKKKIVYVADCIEDGERFDSIFQTAETDKAKLKEFGQELASEWGGECIAVKKWKPKSVKCVRLTDTNGKKGDKKYETTLVKWKRWAKKHPAQAPRFIVEPFLTEEKLDGTPWDCDISDKENLARAEKEGKFEKKEVAK